MSLWGLGVRPCNKMYQYVGRWVGGWMDGQMGGICAALQHSPAWKVPIVTAVVHRQIRPDPCITAHKLHSLN